MGYIFPLGEHYQGYLNVKGCKEFKAEIGPKAGTLWLSIRHLAGCGRAATRAHADP